jgi:hypothetical protein
MLMDIIIVKTCHRAVHQHSRQRTLFRVLSGINGERFIADGVATWLKQRARGGGLGWRQRR